MGITMGVVAATAIAATQVPGVFRITSHATSGLGPWGYAVKNGDAMVLVDVPFFSQELAQTLQEEAPGGVSHILLTHDDFVHLSGHEKWKKAFPKAVRVAHSFDVVRGSIEQELVGYGPWEVTG